MGVLRMVPHAPPAHCDDGLDLTMRYIHVSVFYRTVLLETACVDTSSQYPWGACVPRDSAYSERRPQLRYVYRYELQKWGCSVGLLCGTGEGKSECGVPNPVIWTCAWEWPTARYHRRDRCSGVLVRESSWSAGQSSPRLPVSVVAVAFQPRTCVMDMNPPL